MARKLANLKKKHDWQINFSSIRHCDSYFFHFDFPEQPFGRFWSRIFENTNYVSDQGSNISEDKSKVLKLYLWSHVRSQCVAKFRFASVYFCELPGWEIDSSRQMYLCKKCYFTGDLFLINLFHCFFLLMRSSSIHFLVVTKLFKCSGIFNRMQSFHLYAVSFSTYISVYVRSASLLLFMTGNFLMFLKLYR